ncbi:hypothetical protein ES703_36456 [subsurface metagenome]
MPIRWSALKVSEAADMMEVFINQAAEPLQQVKLVAEEARKIAHLPQYVDQDFIRIIGEIERAIGGGRLEEIGRLRACIASMRKDLPDGSIEAEQERLKHGATQSLM